MKSRACVGFVLVMSAACAAPPVRLSFPPASRGPQIYVSVRVAEDGNAIRRVPLEEYVAGSVISEVAPPSGDDAVIGRMLEVQAIVARTFAIGNRGRHKADGFDLCSTTHCQLYEPSRLKRSRWAALGRAAAARTAGSVIWYKQSPATALFHADCGGHTSTAVDVWRGTARPYLTAKRDDDVAGVVHSAWRFELASADLLKTLNANVRTNVGRRIDQLEVLDRDSSGRAETVALHGERERLVRGEDLRALLTRALGARTVRSTMFTVRRERGTFVFEGRGFGHGVGMCQAGALARLKGGATPEAVLQRYFPLTTLRSLDD